MKLCTVPAWKAKDVYSTRAFCSRQDFLENRFKPVVGLKRNFRVAERLQDAAGIKTPKLAD